MAKTFDTIVPALLNFLLAHRVAAQDIADRFVADLVNLIIKEAELKDVFGQEFFDLRLGQGGDLMEVRIQKEFYLFFLDHSSVIDKDHLFDAELFRQNPNLTRNGRCVLRVALKNANRHGCAIGGGQESDDELLLSLLAIPVIQRQPGYCLLLPGRCWLHHKGKAGVVPDRTFVETAASRWLPDARLTRPNFRKGGPRRRRQGPALRKRHDAVQAERH